MGIEGERPDEARPDSVGADSLPQDRRNAADYNNESAGRDVGRAKRFFPADEETRLKEKEREKEREFNALMRALQDPEYARLYEKARNTVSAAERAVDGALRENAAESTDAESRLQQMRDSAATLADGRKVFRGKDGRLVAEDGVDVTDQRASITGLSDATPRWDDYARQKERAAALAAEREAIERYQREKLDPAKVRLNDPNNPYSKDELEDFIANAKDGMPTRVQKHYDAENGLRADAPVRGSAADEYLGASPLNAPPLQIDFASARDNGPTENPTAPTPATAPKVS